MANSLTPNMEMYLKTIFELEATGEPPRVKMIAQKLGVTMPSVSGAIDNLRSRGLVGHNRYGSVALTPDGSKMALKIKERNDLIYRFLREVLGVPESTARKEACTLEHVVSRRTLDRFGLFLEFIDVCPWGPSDMVEHFVKWAADAERGESCERCTESGWPADRSSGEK